MEVIKVKNYKAFAETLKRKTRCDVNIRLVGTDHTHYQLSKDGIPLGVLCIDKGEASFAPFVTHETYTNDMFINVKYMPMLDDLIVVLKVFGEMFVCEEQQTD